MSRTRSSRPGTPGASDNCFSKARSMMDGTIAMRRDSGKPLALARQRASRRELTFGIARRGRRHYCQRLGGKRMTLFAWVTQARRGRACATMDVFERRQMLAAHVAGIPVSFATIQAAVDAASAGDV